MSAIVDLTGGGGLNNVTDIDSATIGLALTGVKAASGTWWHSTNDGINWAVVGAVSDTSALLLSGTDGRIYFQPNAGFSGTVTDAITFRAWDVSSGTNGTKVTTAGAGTGTSAFSSANDVTNQVVIAGGTSVAPTANIVLSTLNGTEGFKLTAAKTSTTIAFSDLFGNQVAGVGDVNGDGRADIMVGANQAEPTGQPLGANFGEAYVLYGDTTANLTTLANGTTGFSVGSLDGSQGITIRGPGSMGGLAVGLAGGDDVNADGINGSGWSVTGTDTRNVLIDSASATESVTFNVYAFAGSSVSLLVEQDLVQAVV